MTEVPTFEYDTFVKLANSALVAYMEPLLNDKNTRVSRGAVERMLSDLPSYDEYHLVYALQLGSDHSPMTFAPQVPKYLAHEKGSVCCTALNILDKLPDEYVTQDLVDDVRKVVSSYPVRDFVIDILERLAKRMREKQELKKS